MFDEWHWVYMWGILVWVNYIFCIVKSLFDGDASGFDRAKSTEVDNSPEQV